MSPSPSGVRLRGVLHAVWRLGYELEPLDRDLAVARDARPVRPVVDATKGVLDIAQALLEHRGAAHVELAHLGVRGRVGRVVHRDRDLRARVAPAVAQPRADRLQRARDLVPCSVQEVAEVLRIHRPTGCRRIRAMTPEEARGRTDLHFLDVREPDEWEAGHIAGAQHIPLGELRERLAEVPKGRTILTGCPHGNRSEAATRGLRT